MSEQNPELTESQREFAERDYAQTATRPEIWLHKANQLRNAARLLWNHCDDSPKAPDGTLLLRTLRSPAMMLMGMALETLTKGILILRDPTWVEGTKLAGKLKTHNLRALFNDIGIGLDKEEAQLLDRLSESVIWEGRYPVPVESRKLIYAFGDTQHQFSGTDDDWDWFDGVFIRAEAALQSLAQRGS